LQISVFLNTNGLELKYLFLTAQFIFATGCDLQKNKKKIQMKKLLLLTSFAIVCAGVYFVTKKTPPSKKTNLFANLNLPVEDEKEGGAKRWAYEWRMLHDPATGKIPRDIYRREKLLLESIMEKQSRVGFRAQINNTYIAAGPTQNGGRTRAVAYDMRANQVMIAGGVSGGIFRSTNNGATWTYVHPANESRIISCIAQDPRPGFQNTWYAGTGELIGASQAYPNAFIPGFGILKSTDNGVTWTRLTSTTAGSVHNLDNLFDIVFNIQVDANGFVYAAILNRIVKSEDGGTSWSPVLFESTQPSDIEGMATDIVIAKNSSKYYACFSGRNQDADTVGVWQSTTGALNSWSRIAGAASGPGSVSGWRSYNNSTSGGFYIAGWGKTILAVAPSNANIIYVMYDNAQSSGNGVPEADLFRADLSGGSPVWNNRTINLNAIQIDEQGNSTTEYMELQGAYNMMLAIHPTNPNLVLAGGVNLFRSTNGFTSQATFIGGYFSTTYSDNSVASHPDFHAFAFDPNNVNRVVIASDGGLALCNNITATTVVWNLFNSQYQTFQYYHVAIDPTAGSTVFGGGAQDNSTSYKDAKGLLDAPLADPNDHYILIGGDGGMTALSPSTATDQYLYCSVQEGLLVRVYINGSNSDFDLINPDVAGPGQFVTYFHLDQENPNILYYVSDDEIYRTTNATGASTTTGWELLTGVGQTLTGDIFALATTRGAYSTTNSYLFIGTANGKIYRIANPRDALPSTNPTDISPSTGMTGSSLVREIAVNPRNPNEVLAVVSNYGVASAFYTNNATAASPTWQLVEGNISLASFRSCAIVPTTTGTEYYVGTSIGLFSTTTINGASTVWTLEGPSMMQGAIISDLVLRTADNTLLVGTHGNGMFYANIGNVVTGVNDFITNDKNFIKSVNQTFTNGAVYFQPGGQTGIKSINVQVRNMSGQLMLRKEMAYSPGSVDLSQLPSGVYILEILSDNKKYRHVQKVVKNK
jgi:hypothetical protein